jgi:hypothetical protein
VSEGLGSGEEWGLGGSMQTCAAEVPGQHSLFRGSVCTADLPLLPGHVTTCFDLLCYFAEHNLSGIAWQNIFRFHSRVTTAALVEEENQHIGWHSF